METCQEYINHFLVDYFRISDINGYIFNEKFRYLNKALLSGCLYLGKCIKSNQNDAGDDSYEYTEILEVLEKYTEEIEDSQGEVRLTRWFPSVIDREPSFLEFAKILWIDKHYFVPDEQYLFEEIFLPVLVQHYTDYVIVKSIELRDRMRKICYVNREINDKEVIDWAERKFKELMECHYENLYTGEGIYTIKRDMRKTLESIFFESMKNLFNSN